MSELRRIRREARARLIEAGLAPETGTLVEWSPATSPVDAAGRFVRYGRACAGRIIAVNDKARRLADGGRITVESADGEVKDFTYRYFAGWVEAGKRSNGGRVRIPEGRAVRYEIPEEWTTTEEEENQ